jgi:energy-coupling factor transport system permease protein
VVASGVAVGALGWWLSGHQPAVAYPALDAFPPVSGAALLIAVAGLLGPLCSPPPRLVAEAVA